MKIINYQKELQQYIILGTKKYNVYLISILSNFINYIPYKLYNTSISLQMSNFWIKYNLINNIFENIIQYNFDMIGRQLSYILKIQFKRKGSWINIRRKWPMLHLLKFGHGRPMIIKVNNTKLLRYKKHLFYHSIIISFFSLKELEKQERYIKYVRPLNSYTLRGIRTGRFNLHKRKGKISQYKHLKSKIF